MEPSRRLHILIADDYPPNRVLLRQQLEFLGHRVAEAEDGQVALELWADERFEVLISDCNMPRLNGYQLARRIRIQERCERRAPILILGYTGRRRAGTRYSAAATRAWMIACSSRSAWRPCATTSRPLSDATPRSPGGSMMQPLSAASAATARNGCANCWRPC
ncbi:putative two-component sensor [Pseudomonas aeruginosa]|nr:putative two-component sensor [Pseudomonas aeruginosa]